MKSRAKRAGAAAPTVTVKRSAKRSTGTTSPTLAGGALGAKARALVAQIYKHPDDRSLREVLADQLLEDHHVWGELISLQLTNPKRHAARINQLVQRYAREVVGDIANVASRHSMVIVDGFAETVRCAKSSSFTSAGERHAAAIAPQWATVTTVILTRMMPGPFIRALLHNPASAHLTSIARGAMEGRGRIALLGRATSTAPWQLLHEDARRVLDELPAAELARISLPTNPVLLEVLDAARAARAKRATTTKPKPTRARRR